MKRPLFLAALLLTSVFARGEEGPAPAADGRAEGAFRKHLLEKFDAGKDGKLSDSERDAAHAAQKENGGRLRAKVLEKFDADKDGKLSNSEREVAKAALKARQEKNGATGPNGEKAAGRAAAQRQKMLEKFDEDKDGQLNEAERGKAREARKNRTEP